MEKSQYKVAFSGTSGAGKTTLVHYVNSVLGLNWINGSAGQMKKEWEKMKLVEEYGYPGGGHAAVIKYSAINPQYALENQNMLQAGRANAIANNWGFVTDRSPVDNMAYFCMQCSFMYSEKVAEEFYRKCLIALEGLTHLIYVKAVQPKEIEHNGSRVDNAFFQRSMDAVFNYWVDRMTNECVQPPEVLTIDFWDLDQRHAVVKKFLGI
jgi:predicted ATPase